MHIFGTSALYPLVIIYGQIFALSEDHPIFTKPKEKVTNLKFYPARRSLSILTDFF